MTSDSTKAVTASLDNTLKVWEMFNGRVCATVTDVGRDVLQLRLLPEDDGVCFTSEYKSIRVWSLTFNSCLRVIDSYSDPATITLADRGSLLVAIFQGTNQMRVWSTIRHKTLGAVSGLTLTLTKDIGIQDDRSASVYRDQSVCLPSSAAPSSTVLYAFRGTSQARLRNARTGELEFRLVVEAGACISALALSTEYYVLAARGHCGPHLSIENDAMSAVSLLLFDRKTATFVRRLVGCKYDQDMRELYINDVASHAVSVNSSYANFSTDISVWNIEMDDHRHLVRCRGITPAGSCTNLKYVLSPDAAHNSNSVRVWNLSSRVNAPQGPGGGRTKEGIQRIVTISDSSETVVSISFNNTYVQLWNIASDHSGDRDVVVSGQASLEPRTISDRFRIAEKDDIVLHRGSEVIVLSNKGFSKVSEDERSVYQSVNVFDLITQKFTTRLRDCFIVPSPQHEYVVLDGQRLMGLSDNRNHFVIWSLTSGHVTARIKNNFRAMDRRRTDVGLKPNTQVIVNNGDSTPLPEGSSVMNSVATRRRRRGTVLMQPWERRAETCEQKRLRHDAEETAAADDLEAFNAEKANGIEQFIMSGDYSTVVAAYYSHHMCVFDVFTTSHVSTLEATGAMLLLHVAAISCDGATLVHACYDEDVKASYVTAWNTHQGFIRKRLRGEKDVRALALCESKDKVTGEDKLVVVMAKGKDELRIWRLGSQTPVQRIKGYPTLNIRTDAKLYSLKDNRRVVLYSEDISIWDIVSMSLVAVFTPDVAVRCLTVALDHTKVVCALHDRHELLTLSLYKDGKDVLENKENDEESK